MNKYILIISILIASLFADDKLPDTFLKDLNGKKVSVHEYLDGGPVLISFWFLACEPCKKEMKFLDEYHQKYSDSGFKVLSINTDNSRTINRVKPFVKSKKYSFPILNDPKSLFFRKLGGKVCPYTVLVDHKGNIVKKHSGYNPGDEVKLEKEILDMISLMSPASKDTLIDISKDTVKVIDNTLEKDAPSIQTIEE